MYGDYPQLDGVSRILVIKLRHLGDVLLASPVISYLKKRFPDAEIEAYVWKECQGILEGQVDGFCLYDRGWKKGSFWKRVWKELGLLWGIRGRRYDLVVNLTEGERGAVAAWVSGARVRVGVRPKKWIWQKVMSHVVKPCPGERHTVERDLDVIRRIGLFPREDERELVFRVKGTMEGEYVVVHAGSRWRFKCLPVGLMAEVVRGIEGRVVMTGAEGERAYVEEIVRAAGKGENWAGKTSVQELGGIIKGAKGIVTVDSVALHMASALKVPCVALFGPTSEKNWGPWQNKRAVVVAKKWACRPCRLDGCGGSKMSDCLWSLSAQEVVGALSKVVSSEEAALTLNSLETAKTE